MLENNVTLVSAFIANANERKDRSTADYIAYGKKLMAVPINKIIFFDDSLINDIPDDFFNDNKTIIIPVKKEDNYLYQHKEKITDFQLNTTCPEKDTLDYMITICNKTEHVRNAILINTFQSNQFVWVDFGINHVFKDRTDDEFTTTILELREKEFENVRIANIWDPSLYNIYVLNPYKDVLWFFAGGVFGGNPEALIKFADLTKQQCIKVIEENNTLMWEVNIWFQVYLENKELFSLYNCDHKPSILENY
jgi:hypothetical protein